MEEGDYRIGVFGDCGTNTVNQRNTRNQFIEHLGSNYLNAWILLGDNAYNDGTDAEFQAKFFNIYKDALLKKYPLYTSPGNHDYHDVDFTADHAQNTHQTAYYQNFSMPLNAEAGGVLLTASRFIRLTSATFTSFRSIRTAKKKTSIICTMWMAPRFNG